MKQIEQIYIRKDLDPLKWINYTIIKLNIVLLIELTIYVSTFDITHHGQVHFLPWIWHYCLMHQPGVCLE